MVAHLTMTLIALLLTWSVPTAFGQPSADRSTGDVAHVTLVLLKGNPSLAVTYPWRVHPKPSVEVRLVTGDAPEEAKVRPLFFVRDYLKGEFVVDVFHCHDKAAGIENSKVRTENDVEFEILGRRNSLGTPSVTVLRRFDPNEGAPGVAAVFSELPTSAMDKQLLYLDLPPEDFGEAGTLTVWFLREGTIVWTETLGWPGLKKRAASSSR